MKTTEPKSLASPTVQQKSNGAPFFQPEESREGFFGSTQTQEPFFKAAPPAVNNPKPPTIQAKLTIGAPDDVYEQEADAMADKVVQKLSSSESKPSVQRVCAECATEKEEGKVAPKLQTKSMFESNEEPSVGQVQRKCAACAPEQIQLMRIQRMGEEEEPGLQAKRIQRMGEEEEPEVQAKRIQRMSPEEEPELQAKGAVPGPQASPDLESRLGATKGSGTPLPDDTRSSMESSFGADFSGVRVHTNSGAVQMNQELGAQAFTHGSDVYFNSGKYNLRSTEGQKLLAHELTHTIQQTHNKIQPSLQLNRLRDFRERVGYEPTDSEIEATNEYLAYTNERYVWQTELDLTPEEARLACRLILAAMHRGEIVNWQSRAREFAMATRQRPSRGGTTIEPVLPITARIIPCSTLPKQIFNRGACAAGTDFTHHDFQSLAGASTAERAAVWEADNLSFDFQLRNRMRVELGGLAGSEGLRMVSHFSDGSGTKLTHGSLSTLGQDALSSGTFLSLKHAIIQDIERQLSSMHATGIIDCNSITLPTSAVPAVSFGFGDSLALKAIIGGTQGLSLFITSFRITPGSRSYRLGLQVLICDDFGVDTADLYSPALVAFWVLQHRRAGYLPFINELDLPMTENGIY